MLVTFTTPSYSDITLFGDVATSLLKMMGQSGNVPGALMAEDIPPALDALQASLSRSADNDGASSSAVINDDEPPPVPLASRAAPLVSLLESAAAAGDNVMWES